MQFTISHGPDINATANVTILRKANAKKQSGDFPLANLFIKRYKLINKRHNTSINKKILNIIQKIEYINRIALCLHLISPVSTILSEKRDRDRSTKLKDEMTQGHDPARIGKRARKRSGSLANDQKTEDRMRTTHTSGSQLFLTFLPAYACEP